MNPIFRHYPAHPWLKTWLLEPRGCGTTFREKNSGYFFHTAATVGRITPNLEHPEWQLQIPIPQNSRINLMFNGFCGYYPNRKRTCSAEILVPEPGVLWGRYTDIPTPALIAEQPPIEINGGQWLECNTLSAFLLVHDNHFCLISKAHILDDAVQLAKSYLERNLEDHLLEELETRAGASQLFERLTHHDALAAICAESMMRAIRPPEGNLYHRWSQSGSTNEPQLNSNEIHALTLAWRYMDPDTAEEIFLGVLKLQGSSGAIPITYAPRKTFSILEAPKPMMAKTAEKIWQTRQNATFLAAAIPLLRRHTQWLLNHFDHKRRGLHRWQNNNEPIVPNIYETELASVDLTVLLLTEIEALNRLRKQSVDHAELPEFFPDEHHTLKQNLQTQFWNEETSQYSHAFVRENQAQITGFPTLTPLLWRHLPAIQKRILIDQIHTSNSLPNELDVLSWRTVTTDDHDFPTIQKMLLLDIMETHDPNGALLRDFTRLILQQFMEWHTYYVKTDGRLDIDPAMAGFVLNLMATHHYCEPRKKNLLSICSKINKKLRVKKTDLVIVAITLFMLMAANLFYDLSQQSLPFSMLMNDMNSAYANRNLQSTLQSCTQIIDNYPEQAGRARLLAANVMMMRNEPDKAIPLYLAVRADYPDSPGPMVSLGIAYQLQHRFKEAEVVYAEFSYLFDQIFPDIVTLIQNYHTCMDEGFNAPPKWNKIYGYQLMHEL